MFFICLTPEVYDWERILDVWKIRIASNSALKLLNHSFYVESVQAI